MSMHTAASLTRSFARAATPPCEARELEFGRAKTDGRKDGNRTAEEVGPSERERKVRRPTPNSCIGSRADAGAVAKLHGSCAANRSRRLAKFVTRRFALAVVVVVLGKRGDGVLWLQAGGLKGCGGLGLREFGFMGSNVDVGDFLRRMSRLVNVGV